MKAIETKLTPIFKQEAREAFAETVKNVQTIKVIYTQGIPLSETIEEALERAVMECHNNPAHSVTFSSQETIKEHILRRLSSNLCQFYLYQVETRAFIINISKYLNVEDSEMFGVEMFEIV